MQGIPFVINMTLPDDKHSYVHRIGRVGRADRMGLAISLVAAVPEKVWSVDNPTRASAVTASAGTTRVRARARHAATPSSPTRAAAPSGTTSCRRARARAAPHHAAQYLRDIEEHLGVTVPHVPASMAVPTPEYDGSVAYGQKRGKAAGAHAPGLACVMHAVAVDGHTALLAPAVKDLEALETSAQARAVCMSRRSPRQLSYFALKQRSWAH